MNKPIYKQIIDFLKSPLAIRGAFNTIGYSHTRTGKIHVVYCDVGYGIMQEMPMDFLIYPDDSFCVQFSLTPILSNQIDLANAILDEISAETHGNFCSVWDEDNALCIIAQGTEQQALATRLNEIWQDFNLPIVYQDILTLASLTAPYKDKDDLEKE